MVHSLLWKDDSCSAGQEVCFSQNPRIHYHVQKIPPLKPILSQLNLVCAVFLRSILGSTWIIKDSYLPLCILPHSMNVICDHRHKTSHILNFDTKWKYWSSPPSTIKREDRKLHETQLLWIQWWREKYHPYWNEILVIYVAAHHSTWYYKIM